MLIWILSNQSFLWSWMDQSNLSKFAGKGAIFCLRIFLFSLLHNRQSTPRCPTPWSCKTFGQLFPSLEWALSQSRLLWQEVIKVMWFLIFQWMYIRATKASKELSKELTSSETSYSDVRLGPSLEDNGFCFDNIFDHLFSVFRHVGWQIVC